jgi:ribosomal protein L21E
MRGAGERPLVQPQRRSKSMNSNQWITLAIFALAVSTTATLAAENVVKQYEMKDGTTLIVYQDGKMVMQDKNGRAHSMMPGQRMETKDGQVLMMQGNEVWRLEMDAYHRNPAGK